MNIRPGKTVVDGVFSVAGPQVVVELGDTGQANVTIHLALSDGTHINYPDGSGAETVRSTVLPKGDFGASIVIGAFNHGAFGDTYRSSVKIGGRVVATANGALADKDASEVDSFPFVLSVS